MFGFGIVDVQPKRDPKQMPAKMGKQQLTEKRIAVEETPATHEDRDSIFKVDKYQRFDHGYYMENINVIQDVSFGQRNYKRNLDAVLDELFKKG